MELLKDAKLIRINDEEVTPSDDLKNHIVGLYFSASWCPPCRQFTPLLAKTCTELRERGSKFQVVFLSSDRNEAEMMQYFKESHGNWLAAPYGEPIIGKLQEKFSVTTIPKLIIVHENGDVITTRGRKEVTDRGVGAFRSWTSGTQLHVASSTNLNELYVPRNTETTDIVEVNIERKYIDNNVIT